MAANFEAESFGGGRWFRVLPVYPGLVDTYIEGHRFVRAYRDIKTPTALAKSRILYSALVNLEGRVREAAVLTAQHADHSIKTRLKATRKRPEGTPGPHLADNIHSRWLPTDPYDLGIVGVGDIDRLNKVVNPFDRTGKPYWTAIEFGLTTGFVGRRVRGAFMPGGARPDPEEGRRRVHPYFLQGAENDYLMEIKKPIQPQHFLTHGSESAYIYRLRLFEGISRRYFSSLGEILALTAASRAEAGALTASREGAIIRRVRF